MRIITSRQIPLRRYGHRECLKQLFLRGLCHSGPEHDSGERRSRRSTRSPKPHEHQTGASSLLPSPHENLIDLTSAILCSDPRKLAKQTRRRTSKNRRRNDRPLRPVLCDLRPRPNRTHRPPLPTRPLFLSPFILSPLDTPTRSPPRNIPPHRRRQGTAQTPPRTPLGPPRLAQKPATVSHFVPTVSFVHADDGRRGWRGGVDD